MSQHEAPSNPAYSVPVYTADALTVVRGANIDDPLSFADELVLDDDYALQSGAQRRSLSIESHDDGRLTVALGSETGTPGAALHVDCAIQLMSFDGGQSELIVLVELDDQHHVAEIYALPLAPLSDASDYTLVRIERQGARERLAQVSCVSFTRGTHITLSSGAQRPIEDLQVGDAVLTRDAGAQKIRWIGHRTVRADGAFAPILIRAGTLNNDRDLVVSPDHGLFVYQRSDGLGAGRRELLVRARHLVNGDTVLHQDGGFVEYYQLLFDAHQIIYAEGIAAETLLVDPRTRDVLPKEVIAKLTEGLAGHGRSAHLDFEVQKTLLDRPDAAAILKRSSTR